MQPVTLTAEMSTDVTMWCCSGHERPFWVHIESHLLTYTKSEQSLQWPPLSAFVLCVTSLEAWLSGMDLTLRFRGKVTG